jgi:integrase
MARREHQMPNVLRQEGPRPYWYIRIRVRILNQETGEFERRKKWQNLGYCDEITRRQAERLRDEVVGRTNNQVFTLKEQLLFSDFVEIYEAKHMPTLADRGEKYGSLLKNHILPAFTRNRMCDLTTEEVQAFLNQKQEEGLSWWTRNDLKGAISGVYTKAIEWGYWSGKNPALHTSLGPKKTKRKKYGLTDDQIVSLINALPPVIQLMVATDVSTGMRISELSGLRWGSVDLERGVITVQETFFRGEEGETKTEESHRKLSLGMLSPSFAKIRPAGARPDAYVFLIDGKPIDDRDALRRYIRPVAEELGLYFEGFGWRTFRRLNITAMQEGPDAVNVFEAMAQAGHTRPETTMRYTLLQSARRNHAVIGIQDRWLPKNCAGIVRECGNAEIG